MSESRIIQLKSNDGAVFEIPRKAAMLADYVRDSLGDDDDDNDNDDNDNEDDANEMPVIDVLRVQQDCLEKVVAFMKHYDQEVMPEIPSPLGGSTFEQIMKVQWYRDFVSDEYCSQNMLFDLLSAANYMGIKPLLDLACLKVTFQLNGKSAEDIRKILNLPKMTAQEEAKAREAHPWIFEDNNNA